MLTNHSIALGYANGGIIISHLQMAPPLSCVDYSHIAYNDMRGAVTCMVKNSDTLIVGHTGGMITTIRMPSTFDNLNEFKNNGSYYQDRDTGKKTYHLNHGSLFEKELLVPIKKILSTERWGYNRRGINSLSRPLDFDLSVSTEEYKEIKNFNIIFFISQDTG